MELKQIESLLSTVLVGSGVLSFLTAGNALRLDFSAGATPGVRGVYINTNAWVFVENKLDVLDYSSIDENKFFQHRRKILPDLYDLTGYTVESVVLTEKNSLKILIKEKYIEIYTHHVDQPAHIEQDSWAVVADHGSDQERRFIGCSDGEFFVNEKNPIVIKAYGVAH